MKRLFVHQVLNRHYVGPDHTPDIAQWDYAVDKVVNSIVPAAGDVLTRDRCDMYCIDEDWTVTIT